MTNLWSAAKLRWFPVSVGLVILIGIVFRSTGYFVNPIGLWGDEALWAVRLLDNPILHPTFRPLGFMALARGLVSAFSVDERWLRLPSYLASVGSLFLFFYVGHRLFRSRLVVLLLVALAALHPVLIDFAKEFKPYGVELFCHLALVALYLKYRRAGKWHLYTLLLAAATLFFFAYNLVFAFPSLFALLGVQFIRERHVRGLVAVGLGAIVCLALIGTTYKLIWSRMAESDSAFWGKKYDVFYSPNAEVSRVNWQLRKYGDVAAMPGLGSDHWRVKRLSESALREMQDLDWYAWIALHIAGLAHLFRRQRYTEIALFWSPILVALAFNVVDKWPWGSFRTNIFMLAYLLPLPLFAVDDWLTRGSRPWGWIGTGFAIVLSVVPNAAFGWGLHSRKRVWTADSSVPAMIDRMCEVRRAELRDQGELPREWIFIDAYSCAVFDFYRRKHDGMRNGNLKFFEENFQVSCTGSVPKTGRAVRRRAGQRVWVVVTQGSFVEPMYERIALEGEILIDERPTRNQLLLYVQARE